MGPPSSLLTSGGLPGYRKAERIPCALGTRLVLARARVCFGNTVNPEERREPMRSILQHVKNFLALDFQLTGQIIDSNLTHPLSFPLLVPLILRI